MRSTREQPARCYELAKMHKDNTLLRPVILFLGSTYYNLNKILATFRKKTEGANIETTR